MRSKKDLKAETQRFWFFPGPLINSWLLIFLMPGKQQLKLKLGEGTLVEGLRISYQGSPAEAAQSR